MVGAKHVGCSTARNKGTCDNRMTMEREKLEHMVLRSLRDHLMDEQLCAEFCKEYTRRMNELRMNHNASLSSFKAELSKLERETQQIIRSIQEGVPGALLKDRSIAVQNRKEELQRLLVDVKEETVLFHPNMANRYQMEIRNLLASLHSNENRAEAATILRSLIDRIVLTPTETGDRLTVDLFGDLAGILSIATKRDRQAIEHDLSKHQPVQLNDFSATTRNAKTTINGGFPSSIALVAGKRSKRDYISGKAPEALVAGAGFEPAAFRL